jgi:hypothetical protein
MRRTVFFCLISAALASPAHADGARDLLSRAIAAMGGEAALRGLTSVHLQTVGHEYYIEQSERPEGPFIVQYHTTSEDRDSAHGRARIEIQDRDFQTPSWSPARTVVFDGEAVANVANGSFAPVPFRAADTVQWVDLAPERVLFLALAAPDLTLQPDVLRQGVLQHVAAFGWRGKRVRLLINSYDNLPTALELTRPDEWGVWGDVRDTMYYSFWTLLPGGIRYPLQFDRTWNGVTLSSTTIVELIPNAAIDAARFEIPADVKTAYAALPAVRSTTAKLDVEHRRIEVAPGVVQYGGGWNVEVVQQPDGLVIIEAPISSAYSAQVLDEISRRYPGAKVKAVISTSDSWPHIGGVREYVARGIPVYAMELNRPILERLLAADYGQRPDRLATTRRKPDFRWVSTKTTIGSGDTQIFLFPAREENGERMLFVYMPALKLLYTADEIQRRGDGSYFMPEYLQEVQDVIAREGIAVDRIVGMHAPPTPWSAIRAALAAAVK